MTSSKPTRSTIDVVDDAWDAVASRRALRDGRSVSPTRSGTIPWDDRTLPMFAGGESGLGRIGARDESPIRRGTASADELLPAAVKYRRAAQVEEIARATRPVRGGTRSWDELLAEMQKEQAAESDALCVEATNTVFGSTEADPFDDLPTHMLDWLTPGTSR